MRIVILAVLALGLLASCKKVNVEGQYVPSSRNYTVESFLSSNLGQPEKVKFRIIDTLFNDTVITFGDGNELWFNPQDFTDAAGNKVVDSVIIRYTTLIRKSDYILADKPAVAENEALVSRGTYRIDFIKNNQQVKLTGATFKVPAVLGEELDPEMELFLPGTNSIGQFSWQQENLATTGILTLEFEGDSIPGDTNGNSFEMDKYAMAFLTDSIGWINIDKFYNSPEPKGLIRFTFPKNDAILLDEAAVYVVFKNFRGVMQAFREDDNHFVLDRVPFNEPIAVVAIAFEGIDVFGHVFEAETKAGFNANVTLTETTEQDLISQIHSVN